MLGAFAVGSLLAAVIVIASWAGDPEHKTAYGDGLIYRYVASHLSTPPGEINPVVSERDRNFPLLSPS